MSLNVRPLCQSVLNTSHSTLKHPYHHDPRTAIINTKLTSSSIILASSTYKPPLNVLTPEIPSCQTHLSPLSKNRSLTSHHKTSKISIQIFRLSTKKSTPASARCLTRPSTGSAATTLPAPSDGTIGNASLSQKQLLGNGSVQAAVQPR